MSEQKILITTDHYFGDMSDMVVGHRIVTYDKYIESLEAVKKLFDAKGIGVATGEFPSIVKTFVINRGHGEGHITSFNHMIQFYTYRFISSEMEEILVNHIGESVGFDVIEEVLRTAWDTYEDDFEPDSELYEYFESWLR